MSDGPYSSLQMPPGWKKACKIAQNPSHSMDEVRDAIRAATLSDFHREVGLPALDALAKILGAMPGQTGNLDPVRALGDLRLQLLPTDLNRSLIENVTSVLEEGLQGRKAMEEGLRRAVCERMEASARQAEEHYRRAERSRQGQDRTQRIRDNLNSPIAGTTPDRVVQQQFERMAGKRGQLRTGKQDRTSDGPHAPKLKVSEDA